MSIGVSLAVLGLPNKRWDNMPVEVGRNYHGLAAIACKSQIVSVWKVSSNFANVSIGRRWHVLTNALNTVVVYHTRSDDFPLLPKSSCEDFITLEFLEMISDDLAGATRAPMVSLGSDHEANCCD